MDKHIVFAANEERDGGLQKHKDAKRKSVTYSIGLFCLEPATLHHYINRRCDANFSYKTQTQTGHACGRSTDENAQQPITVHAASYIAIRRRRLAEIHDK